MSISIAVSLVYEYTLRRREDDRRRTELRCVIQDVVDNQLMNSQLYGLSGLRDKLDFASMFAELKTGDCLLWLDTYAPGHVHWIDEMKSALERNCTIKMLILDPHCDNAKYRSEELGGRYTHEVLKEELLRFQREMESISRQRDYSARMEVLTYRDLPGIPMYIVVRDGTPIYAYSSIFLTRATGVSFPHFVWQYTHNGLVQFLYDHFMAKWNRTAERM